MTPMNWLWIIWDKIFDPFAGGGSFLVACQQLGFAFVGCEKEEKYCKIIEERLTQKNLLQIMGE